MSDIPFLDSAVSKKILTLVSRVMGVSFQIRLTEAGQYTKRHRSFL